MFLVRGEVSPHGGHLATSRDTSWMSLQLGRGCSHRLAGRSQGRHSAASRAGHREGSSAPKGHGGGETGLRDTHSEHGPQPGTHGGSQPAAACAQPAWQRENPRLLPLTCSPNRRNGRMQFKVKLGVTPVGVTGRGGVPGTAGILSQICVLAPFSFN